MQCTAQSDCHGGQRCVNNTCVDSNGDAASDIGDAHGIDGALDSGDASTPCDPGAPCSGGICAGGQCCPSERVCGEQCCASGATCFANACVMPGALCRTDLDCEPGTYCEPSLGPSGTGDDGGVVDGGDASADGATDAGGPRCVPFSGSQGRCIPRPPRCADGDGGTSDGGAPDGGACISTCEYRPRTGLLDATLLWDWNVHTAREYTGRVDVWSTPAVGRVYDANCDGTVNSLDPPNVIFVSGRSINPTTGLGTCCQCTGGTPTACHTGTLRVLDGRSGDELLSLASASRASAGFAGVSVALGDLDRDRDIDIAAVTGEGYVVVIDRTGTVLMTSDAPIPGAADSTFGWGGGLAIADMDHDNAPEIVYGATVFTTAGGSLRLRWTGAEGQGGGAVYQELSTLADVDGAADNKLELVAGRTVYHADGTILWNRADLPDGFPAVADLDGDHHPEVVLVASGRAWILDAATGVTRIGPVMLPGSGAGGPPTIADFDGTPGAEIGIAQQNFYTVLDPNFTTNTAPTLWSMPNHDLSSSVTGSTVFDFEGDGVAEVLYADECFVWVFDGPTGNVRWAGLTESFTGTEASIVADVDGDGHAEIVVVSNGADPSPAGWRCLESPWNAPDPRTGRPAWAPPPGESVYRGVRVFRDAARSWVGTRTIWNEHTYHVTNVCMPGDDACEPGSYEGQIPLIERQNWTLPWLNNFRQNVQQAGLFAAPDATITLAVSCEVPPVLTATVRNLGEAILPAGVTVAFFSRAPSGTETMLGTGATSTPLFPGSAQTVTFATTAGTDTSGEFVARIVIDPAHPTFHECREGNNESAPARAPCPG
jgi:hypothetical protein